MWKLGHEWVEYARMPKEQYKQLLNREMDGHGMDGFLYKDAVGLRSFFSEGYLLVFVWRWSGACANVLVLFDIAMKLWRKVDLPTVTMYKLELAIESSPESEDFEDEEYSTWKSGFYLEASDDDEVDDDDGYVYGGGNVRGYVYFEDNLNENVDEDDDVYEEDDKVDA